MPNQKIVIIAGKRSYLLFGDTEEEENRFLKTVTISNLSASVGCALPVLLEEGWVIESIFPFNGKIKIDGEFYPAAIVLLKAQGEEGDESGAPSI